MYGLDNTKHSWISWNKNHVFLICLQLPYWFLSNCIKFKVSELYDTTLLAFSWELLSGLVWQILLVAKWIFTSSLPTGNPIVAYINTSNYRTLFSSFAAMWSHSPHSWWIKYRQYYWGQIYLVFSLCLLHFVILSSPVFFLWILHS